MTPQCGNFFGGFCWSMRIQIEIERIEICENVKYKSCKRCTNFITFKYLESDVLKRYEIVQMQGCKLLTPAV